MGAQRQGAQWQPSDPEEIRQTADEILEQGIYQPPQPSLIERAIEWLLDRLGDVLPSTGPGSSGGPGSFVLGWILLILAAAAILWFLLRVMPSRLPRRGKQKATVEQSVRRSTSRREWLKRAADAEADRQWREAVRCRYRALAAGLVDRNELPAAAGATAGEYRDSFDATVDRSDAFGRASDRFEDIWYGGQDASDADARSVEEEDQLVMGRREKGAAS